MPGITHLLPIRNGQMFVQRIVGQIVANTSLGDEILIIEDGSTDNTFELLLEEQKAHPEIRIVQSGGLGLVAALNLGLIKSRNDWIARYDADDEYQLDRIKKQRKLIGDGVSAIFSDYRISVNGISDGGTIPSPIFHFATVMSLFYSQQTAHPSVLLNRSKVNLVGGYREEEFPAEDLGLWIRLVSVGELLSVPEVLINYTLSLSSISAIRRDDSIFKQKELIHDLKYTLAKQIPEGHMIKLEFEKYGNYPNRIKRRILFLRNLKRAQRYIPVLPSNKDLELPSLLRFTILHPISTLDLFRFQMRRAVFRKYAK